ncbi:MAG TPA: lipase family protein, partial [Vicinamibacterales bacterium]|nr:lipase family protein [Vicinamibacterales bacterium]
MCTPDHDGAQRFMQVTEAHIVAARTRAATVSRQLGGNADSLLARVISGYRPPEPSATDVRHAPQAATWEALLHAPAIDALQPAAELHPTYDLSAYLAHRSERAYDGESAIKTEIEQQGGAHFQRFAHWPDAAFVYLCGRTAVVAFRGTVPRNVPQWFYTDLFALPLIGTPARHIGFDLAWRRLRPDITTWLASHLPTDGDIVLTGHSLGAALALIAGHDLAVRGYRIRGIVTLGTPRVGFEAFQNAFLSTECYPAGSGASARTLSAVTRRLTHADDLVSRMPPPPFFRHVGEGLVISGDGHLNTDES